MKKLRLSLIAVSCLFVTRFAFAEKDEPKPSPAKPGRLLTKQPACKPLADDELVRLDFDQVPLHDLVAEVGRALCKNFVIEPGLAHQPVVVVSASELRAGALWSAFLSILSANDLTLIDRPGYAAIVPATEATRETVPIYGPRDAVPSEDRMVTKIVEVRDRDLNAVANFLNIFKSAKGQVHPFVSSNMLVMTDFAPSIAKLEWLLGQMTKSPGK